MDVRLEVFAQTLVAPVGDIVMGNINAFVVCPVIIRLTSVNTGIVVSPIVQLILVTPSMASTQMKGGSVLCPFKPFLAAVCDFESVSDVRKTIGR